MSWRDHVTHPIRLSVAWHEAGCPGGDEYVDWLIERRELVTRKVVDDMHDQHVKTLTFNREQHEKQMRELEDKYREDIPAEHRKLARTVRAVVNLVDVRRKTLRMDDLRAALRDDNDDSLEGTTT